MEERDKQYYSAISLLQQGIDAHTVADNLGISVSKVIRWNSDFKRHRDDGTLDKLLNMDELVIHTAAQLINAPTADEVKAIAKVSGLQLLEQATQICALNIVNRIQSFASSAQGAGELSDLTDSLCRIQTAFFNPNKVQVNVQNNINDGAAYTGFLGDKPGA